MHSKFFMYNDSIFQQMFSISNICPDLLDPEYFEALETDGCLVLLDTRNILNKIELEALTSEEVREVRANLCQYNAYV